MREIIKYNSTKFLIVSMLFSLSLNISSQELPLSISRHTGKHYDEFGSGVKYYFVNPGESLENSFIKELYYDGKAAYEQKKYKEAKRKLLEFMNNEISANDINENGLLNNKVLKYYACLMLKEIYYNEKEYKLSLYYNNLSKSYSYLLGRCGFLDLNVTTEDSYFFTCYDNLGDYNLAISRILPKIISSTPVDSLLTQRLVSILKQNNNPEYLKSALSNCFEQPVPIGFSAIKFLNHYLYIRIPENIYITPRVQLYLTDEEKNVVKEKIQNHLFYKLIMEN